MSRIYQSVLSGGALTGSHVRHSLSNQTTYSQMGEMVVVLVPDVTMISQYDPTTQFGNWTWARISWATGKHFKALFHADLSAYAGRTCLSAKLYVYEGAGGGSWSWANLHEMLTTWAEMEATWNEKTTGVGWALPGLQAGADYDGTVVGTTWYGHDGWHYWTTTSVVQAWLSGARTNYGWLGQRLEVENDMFDFWSDDYLIEPEKRPYLEMVLQ